jgi:hypothetical protein
MPSPFRENAVQALANTGGSRARTSLVTPRRALVALAVIALIVAGLLYVAVNSLTTPIVGIGWADRGGFVTVVAPTAGKVSAPNLASGVLLAEGEQFGELTTPDGKTTALTAPEDSIVMQRGSVRTTFTVTEGETIATLAVMADPATLLIVLPGIEATGLTASRIAEGAAVWVQPQNGESFQCTLYGFNAYEQSGADIVEYIPSPTVARFVQANGSVIVAGAQCPEGTLDDKLVGVPSPVSVEVDRRSLLSFVFGGS